MSFYLSVFDKNQSMAVDLATVAAAIQTQVANELVSAARQRYQEVFCTTHNHAESHHDEKFKRIKTKLPAFTPSGLFGESRQKSNLIKHSGYVSLDIDGVDEAELLRLKALARADSHCLLAFVSPSGAGLKLIYAVGSIGAATHKNGYLSAKVYVEEKYGICIEDTAGIDVNRLMYLSSDPDCHFNPHAVPLPMVTAPDDTQSFDDEDLDIATPSGIGEPMTHEDNLLIHRAKNAANGSKFAGLWSGTWEHSEYMSQSEADAALLAMLCYWTGGNKAKSFRLFANSGLCRRDKWSRLEYRNDTWAVVTKKTARAPKPVIESFGVEQPDAVPITKPWQALTEEQVRQAISGTLLKELVDILESVMRPALPLSITLPKALVMMGAAMAQPKMNATGTGIRRARLIIQTAGGMCTNAWGLIAAPAAAGKDIGNVVEHGMRDINLFIGTTGSAEGLADAYKSNGAAVLCINELEPYLKPNTWQASAAGFLLSAFSKGFFKYQLSKKQGSGPNSIRESNYCFPSITANIPPKIFAGVARPEHLESGLLSRFIVGYTDDTTIRRPASIDPEIYDRARNILQQLQKASGSITPPDNYLGDVLREFELHGASYLSTAARLVNEYGPKFAVILAADGSDTVTCTPEQYERAGILVRWFYGMAERLFSLNEITDYEQRREAKISKFLRAVQQHPGITKSDLARNHGRGTSSEERETIVTELAERGLIQIIDEGGPTRYCPVSA